MNKTYLCPAEEPLFPNSDVFVTYRFTKSDNKHYQAVFATEIKDNVFRSISVIPFNHQNIIKTAKKISVGDYFYVTYQMN